MREKRAHITTTPSRPGGTTGLALHQYRRGQSSIPVKAFIFQGFLLLLSGAPNCEDNRDFQSAVQIYEFGVSVTSEVIAKFKDEIHIFGTHQRNLVT